MKSTMADKFSRAPHSFIMVMRRVPNLVTQLSCTAVLWEPQPRSALCLVTAILKHICLLKGTLADRSYRLVIYNSYKLEGYAINTASLMAHSNPRFSIRFAFLSAVRILSIFSLKNSTQEANVSAS